MATIFETERLIVRQYTRADYDNYFSLHGNPVVMQYIRPAQTREDSDAKFEETILNVAEHSFMGRWAVVEKSSGKFIGSFVIIPIPDDMEKTQLGYSFLPEHWGKGFATEVTMAGLKYFYNKTPLFEIYAVTETPNVASQKVLLKAGFLPFGNKFEKEKELKVFIFRRNDFQQV
ncbi:MAG: GNAT family N-acetyltransferase [Chitinophagaceae bacterium]